MTSKAEREVIKEEQQAEVAHQRGLKRQQRLAEGEPLVEEDNPLDFSAIRNRHEDLAPEVPRVLHGEVKAGASDPDQQDTVSVLANAPDHRPATVATPLTGEVVAGASQPGEVPPSVFGTDQDPGRHVTAHSTKE